MLAVHAALKEAYAFSRATTSTPRTLRVLTLGDSAGPSMPSILLPDWNRRLGHTLTGAAATQTSELQALPGTSLVPITITTGTAALTSGAYAYGWSGQYYALATTSDVSWGLAAAIFPWTKLKVYYAKESGAGTLGVSVNGGTATTAAAANASIVLGVMSLSNANPFVTSTLGTSIRITTTGGPVKILAVVAWDETHNGVCHLDLSLAGLSMNNSLSTATGQAILGGIIADFAPAVLWCEQKENSDYAVEGDVGGRTFASRIAELATLINANKPPECDVVMVASNAIAARATYDPLAQAALLSINATLKTVSGANDYLFVDGTAALGAQSVLQAFVEGATLPVPIRWQGAYNSGTTYALNDVVTNGGSTFRYINASATAGNATSNTTFWRPQWGAYAAGTTYSLNDIATNGGYAWSFINATPSAGNTPPTFPVLSNAFWQMVWTFSLDGTNQDTVANATRVARFNVETGIAASPHSFVTSALNEAGLASVLAGGSKFTHGKTAQELKVTAAVPSNAVDWVIDTPASLRIRESTGNLPMLVLNRQGNVASTNNPLYAAYFGGAICLDAEQGNALLRSATIAAQAASVEVWHRTNAARGNLGVGALVAGKWVQLPSYTKATVPAAATAGAGALIYVTDTTGGAQVCVSTGTVWRMMANVAIA